MQSFQSSCAVFKDHFLNHDMFSSFDCCGTETNHSYQMKQQKEHTYFSLKVLKKFSHKKFKLHLEAPLYRIPLNCNYDAFKKSTRYEELMASVFVGNTCDTVEFYKNFPLLAGRRKALKA